jgi:putative flippase GtrA
MLQQLGLFTLVGAAGFLVDAGMLLLLANALGVNIYVARLLSWLAAATFTWLLNRTLTFRDRDTAVLRQWLTFLAANTGGGLINICLSSALIAAHVAPIPAIACGSLAGLLSNFLSSREFVFRRRARPHAPGAAQAGPE